MAVPSTGRLAVQPYMHHILAAKALLCEQPMLSRVALRALGCILFWQGGWGVPRVGGKRGSLCMQVTAWAKHLDNNLQGGPRCANCQGQRVLCCQVTNPVDCSSLKNAQLLKLGKFFSPPCLKGRGPPCIA
eukprot:356120-Chlamydomonas_euryale.AAC.16